MFRLTHAAATRRVSIHAPRFREAMISRMLREWCEGSFNPRPPFPGGDGGPISPECPRTAFQSTPPVSGRRWQHPTPARSSTRVSIHAPRFREAMARVLAAITGRALRFNPRPPFPGGDALSGINFMRPMVFQSTPPVSGRRCHLPQLPEASEQKARIARTSLFLSKKHLTRPAHLLESRIKSGNSAAREPTGESMCTWGSRKLTG